MKRWLYCLGFLGVAVAGGFLLSYLWAFASMVNPDLAAWDRTREILGKLLGFPEVVGTLIAVGLIMGGLVGFFSSLRRPDESSTRASSTRAAVLLVAFAVVILGSLFCMASCGSAGKAPQIKVGNPD